MSDQNELAEERTDWAEDRTSLANERTFAGWMRTGMASIAVAIGLRAVFGAFEPTWVAKAVASIFLAAALFMFWSAQRQAKRTHSRLSQRDASIKTPRYFIIVAVTMALGTIGTGITLWSL
ncbi:MULTISPECIES: YidH family protein [Roseobacteraceae]|jgi:putative membrane protein|uniref:DNA polymerase III subunit gamma/tau n=1 Tax=Pseudosulfitobacter pseudonitzschiae TaxID=1402135 RepID=A0A221K3K3_9RHOB|nr:MULTISPECIES: DUF202 domain-containing protein [Roseobacteraceae]ASM73569.1 DNA polymerase III subunit gamma/tau [Pseudosulfitobacter pseudonitzschiae]